jgi:hypothetical protein
MIKLNFEHKFLLLPDLLIMSIEVKFHVDIGGDHIDIESFYRFRQFSIVPAPS